jgi:beta-lactamase regulating signal transducer with metallopeptidase domain
MSTLIKLLTDAADSAAIATAVDSAIKIAFLLALACVVARALWHSSAALRHLVWTAAIAGALVLPVLALTLPAWHIPIPGAGAARALAGRVGGALGSEPGAADVDVRVGTGQVNGGTGQVTAETNAKTEPLQLASAAAAAATVPTSGPVHVTLVAAQPRLGWPAIASIIWLAGAVVALVPLLLGILQLRSIGGRVHDVESDALDDYAASLARSLGVRRVVRVVEGEAVSTPMTWGILRPVVLVPAGFGEWPEARQRDVLLHELAHVARYDCLTQYLASVVCALHWYNPLAWVAARNLRIERERACDDRVLLAGARASEYAEHLLTIARTLRTPGAAGAAALAMARPSHLEGRLLAVLDTRRQRATLTRRRAAGIGSGALVIAAVVATLSPWSARTAAATERQPLAGVASDTDSVAVRRRAARDSLRDLLRKLPNDSLFALLRETGNDSILRALRHAPHDSLIESLAHAGSDSLVNPALFNSLQALLDTLNGIVGPGIVLADGQRLTRSAAGGAVISSEGASSDDPTAFRLPGCSFANHRSSSATVNENDSHMKASVKNGECQVTLEREGTIQFNRNFTDITSVDADGWVSIYDKGGSTTHKLRIERGAGSSLARTWYVNGTKQPYDSAAARWLATSLQELDRYTNFSNGARMAVVYRERGVDGVLDEAATTSSDYTKRSDIEGLLKIAKLDQQQTDRVLGFVASDMSGDYDKSQLLQALLKQGLISPALQPKFITAAATISGDYERRQVLTALVQNGSLNASAQNAVYAAALHISGDYDMRELLLEVVKKYGLSKETAPAFMAAAARISSDYDMRTLLTTVLDEQSNLEPSIIDSFIDLGAKRITSDYDKAEFFIAVAQKAPNTDAERERIAKAAESISSESDYGRVLASLRRIKKSSGSM